MTDFNTCIVCSELCRNYVKAYKIINFIRDVTRVRNSKYYFEYIDKGNYHFDCFIGKYPNTVKIILEENFGKDKKDLLKYAESFRNVIKMKNLNKELQLYKNIEFQLNTDQKKAIKSLLVTLTHYDDVTSPQYKLELISYLISRITPVFKSEVPLYNLIVENLQ